ncbi:unnamed protein product, partial [marine sediment metagenome]
RIRPLPDSEVAKIRAAGYEELKKIGSENARCARAIEIMEDYLARFEKSRQVHIP